VTAAFPGLLTGCGGSSAAAGPTLQQKIAQMLMVGFRGLELKSTDAIVRDIAEYGIGGTILFDRDVMLKQDGRNIVSAEQLKALTAQLRSYATVPLFIAVDQEGGKVARLKERYGFPPTVSAQYLGTVNDPDLTRTYADSIAVTLAENGLNMNFAPVVDLNVNPDSPAIGRYERSFSADPDIVTAHARVFIKEHEQYQVATCLKHFPGHGSATDDSHDGFVDVSDTWSETELEPYRRLIPDGNCRMVMTAHIFNRNIDPVYPATLSRATMTGILRERFAYDGVIVSDDMQMGAIINNFSFETAVEKAILAGVDIILTGNNLAYDPDFAPKTIDIITRLIQNGTIPVERIDKAYSRIMTMKQSLKG